MVSKDVVILGMGDSRVKCPWAIGYEIWGVNNVYKSPGVQYVNKLFIAHKQVYKEGQPYFDWQEMNKLGIEIVSLHKIPKLKHTLYPYKEITEYFDSEYFSNCLCYMVAYALFNGYRRLMFYGADMLYNSDYAEEKGGMEYWLGRAHGLGVITEFTETSDLLKTINKKPYGF